MSSDNFLQLILDPVLLVPHCLVALFLAAKMQKEKERTETVSYSYRCWQINLVCAVQAVHLVIINGRKLI